MVQLSMSSSEAKTLIRRAVCRHFVLWAYVREEECLLAFGDGFRAKVESFLETRNEHVKLFERYCASLDAKVLKTLADVSKPAGLEQHANELTKLRKAAFTALAPRNKYVLIAIGASPDEAADYKMWSLRDSFDGQELMWLSLGLEPTPELNEQFQKYRSGWGDFDAFVGKEAVKRLDIINRSETLGVYGSGTARGTRAREWFDSVELEAPTGFGDMLQTTAVRLDARDQSQNVVASSGSVKASSPDPRGVRSIAKLVAAMATDGYGWDHSDKRSPIAGELESVCDKLGVSVSRETILKYLRMGASYFPEDE